jgi:hypothetical protein
MANKIDSISVCINVLIQGCTLAQQKGGVYTLEDAALIAEAIEFVNGYLSPEASSKKIE